MKITLPTKPIDAQPVTRAQAHPGLAEPEYRPKDQVFAIGQIVELVGCSRLGEIEEHLEDGFYRVYVETDSIGGLSKTVHGSQLEAL